MQITGVDTVIIGNPWKNWILVRLETDAGILGVGEGTLEHRTRATDAAIRELAGYIVGRDPTDVERLLFDLRQETYTPGILVHTVAAAFEVAAWDILGKRYETPVHRLLGGRVRDRVPVYANGWYKVERTPDQFQKAAEQVLDKGFRALKFDPFGAAHGSLGEKELHHAIAITGAVKEVADTRGASIIVEGHARFDAATAKRVARAIEPFEPLWFEEPVFYHDIAGQAAVRLSTTVSIAAGERGVWLQEFVEFCRADAVDTVQPDIAHVGGLWAAKKIATVAEGFGKYCTFHCPLSPVTTAASLQLSTCTVNAHLQECFDHFNPEWTHDIFGAPPTLQDGAVEVGDLPGLGIEVNWAKALEHPFAEHNRQFLFRSGWEKRQGLAKM